MAKVIFNVNGRDWSFSSLLTTENTKTAKNRKFGYGSAILQLAPESESVPYGGRNLCPFAGACAGACLKNTGHNAMDSAQQARIARTLFFIHFRTLFFERLLKELRAYFRKCARDGLRPVVRLNGLSDILWERELLPPESGLQPRTIFDEFPDVQFYDYTKIPARVDSFLAGEFPANYSIVFSRDERNEAESVRLLNAGATVAVVFQSVPTTWNGFPVVDGDEHDAVFVRDQRTVLGLKAKGPARKDTSGFVVF